MTDAAAIELELARTAGMVRRYLYLDPARLAALGDSGALGRHWTTDASDMSFDALLVPPEADANWALYEVAGYIDGAWAVDIEATLRQRDELPWEREVVLREDAVVAVGAIRRVDQQTRALFEFVRRDLHGRSLRALVEAGPELSV